MALKYKFLIHLQLAAGRRQREVGDVFTDAECPSLTIKTEISYEYISAGLRLRTRRRSQLVVTGDMMREVSSRREKQPERSTVLR